MRDRELYATILGVQAPWTVERVELDVAGGAVHVWLTRAEGAPAPCPECQTACPIYDHRERSGGISTRASSKLGCTHAYPASTAPRTAWCRAWSRGRLRARSSRCCSSGWQSTGCGKRP